MANTTNFSFGADQQLYSSSTPITPTSGSITFDQSSVNPGTLGTEIATGELSTDSSLTAFDTSPVFTTQQTTTPTTSTSSTPTPPTSTPYIFKYK